MSEAIRLETIVALAKRRGFVYPTSEIYGGLANAYDYGPLGAQLLKNIRDLWWKRMVEEPAEMVGLDSQILQHPETWVASGHVASFNDPLVEDLLTHKRYRADHLLERWLAQLPPSRQERLAGLEIESLSIAEMTDWLKREEVKSPEGNPLGVPKQFNLLFETSIGTLSEQKSLLYLRGETAQGIFANFKQIVQSNRVQLPFGVGQLGKSFRNEITTGQFVFRTLEFEQAEIEYFFDPKRTAWQPLFKLWQERMWRFVTEDLGISESNLRWRRHSDAERSFYSLDTYDLDYHFPFGFKELWGLAYRTDYDLKQHQAHSGQDLRVRDAESGEMILPHVIEPALGINRAFLMILTEAMRGGDGGERAILRLKPSLAPVQLAVFPLLRNKPPLVVYARRVFDQVRGVARTQWDDRGNIGKRYLYQDEIGTPWCATIDFETLETDEVTMRARDSGRQERVAVARLSEFLALQLSK